MAEQNTKTVSTEDGLKLFEAVADTGMNGVSIQAHGSWHSAELVQQYIDALTDLKIWLDSRQGE